MLMPAKCFIDLEFEYDVEGTSDHGSPNLSGN